MLSQVIIHEYNFRSETAQYEASFVSSATWKSIPNY